MTMKTVYIKDIRSGDKIRSPFLVTEKNLAFSQKGAPYLSLRLRDKTGDLEGRIWDNVDALQKLFKKGDVILVQARAVSYKNVIQMSITDVAMVEDSEIDPADYSPVSRLDVEEMFRDLMAFIGGMENPWLRQLLTAVFGDEEIVGRFKLAPAAKGFHHAYLGGLLEHTLSTTRLLDRLAGQIRGIDRDLLIAGGLLHDIGKIYEFSYDRVIDYTTDGRLVGHIVMGVELLDRKIEAMEDFPRELSLKLRHLLLSHHGELEFGSPKRPKTVDALVLHAIDDLDAKVAAMQDFVETSAGEDSEWTGFHRFFERFIYKGKS
jgi:3'-5' exoribonuclease